MTTEFQRAKLQEVKANKDHSPIGDSVEVQFNPSSLKLKLSNKTEGGRSTGKTKRQHNGVNAAVLSMELVFDTADEFNGDNPVSVQTRTAIVEKYIFPTKKSKDKPPLLQFQWDAMIITGIVESLDIDFEHFAPNGTPLRAKCNLTIKEQKPEYQYNDEGPGSRNNGNAAVPLMASVNQPGQETNDPGSSDKSSNNDQSAPALDNETAAEFASRMGLDPSAWRGLDVDLSAGLTLKAGIEVGFSADLSISAGVGITMGLSAGIDLSLEASVGLDASVGVSSSSAANINSNTAAGFAMSAVGGVAAAIESVKDNKVQSASAATSAAFTSPLLETGSTSSSSSSTSSLGSVTNAVATNSFSDNKNKIEQQRSPLNKTGVLSYTEKTTANAAPTLVTADKRATSYGFGVPLRPQYKTLLEQTQPRLCREDQTQSRSSEGQPVFRKVPTTSPWLKLPRHSSARDKADIVQKIKNTNPCRYLYND